MEACSGNSKPIKNVNNLDYLFRKSSWCVKNNLVNRLKICMFIENIIRLSANSFSLEHLFYANDLIEYLSENFASEPKYVYYLKRMLVLCLMPPTVKNITQCSNNLSTLTRFYDIMVSLMVMIISILKGKCIESVRDHTELCMIAFSVVQSSVLRRQHVPENSVSLPCCYEALENSDLPVTLMQCIGHHDRNSQTFLDDLLKLSYNIAVVSDRSAVVSDTLNADDRAFRTVGLCGLYALNIFYRENQQNSETHTTVFNTVMRTVKLYFTDEVDGEKFDQSVLLDVLHFIKNTIIRQRDQVEHFVAAGGVENLLNLLAKVKYPVQLVILGMLVDLTGYQLAKRRVEKWKSAKTGDGYVELACDIWRSEKIRFEFLERNVSDDEYIFREQREQTTAENLLADRSPAVESMYLCAQPKIYALLRSVGFSDDDGGSADDRDVNENTVRACGLATNFWDKATVAHIYHYYSLKLGEVWNENDMVSREPDRVPMSAVETESVDIMTIRHAYLIALLKMIKNRVHDANSGAGRSVRTF
ncbi:Hypothetical protein CINCED_3A007235 [Cinara cedri]|uniref:Cilia- and flagella-associated protein 69 ARM repeats domain-containing protein n=1 Tax=Cinara cedri TaxID=506608 RepID=A0A5E4M197_9HEMI|nr:Hypothetical protein CINCED_3A007235 [Cinara cedri]